MASLLETLRNNILKSLYGRRMGFDKDDYLVGIKDVRVQIEDVTSTVATTVSAFGVTRILTSGSSQGPVQHSLPAPVPGLEKRIILDTTSTGSYQFLSTANGASILAASDGTTKGVITLRGPGGAVSLVGLTTDTWGVMSVTGTTTNQLVSFTTSTA